MSLHVALAAHRATLGNNFENLGKKGTYLCFHANKWSIVNLNCLQQWLRYLFGSCGAYSSTHLTKISKQLQLEADLPPELRQRINQIWVKAYLSKPFPVPQQVNAHFETNATLGIILNRACCTVETGDITKQNVDAIVNAANKDLIGRGGVDGAIHKAAGPGLQRALDAMQKAPLATGDVVVTPAFNFNHPIQYIAHTVGPIYGHEGGREKELLTACVTNSLNALAKEEVNGRPAKVAFPAISTGTYGYPFDQAIRVMFQAILKYVQEHPRVFSDVKIVVLPGKLNEAKVTAADVIKNYPLGDR